MTSDTPRPRGRPPGPPRNPNRRRAEILDAAERVIARTGPHMTIAQVATEAGYARTAVYAVFPDLRALIDALAERHLEGVLTAADAVLAQPLPIRDLLRAIVRLMFDFLEDNPPLHHVLMQRLDSGAAEYRPLFTRVSEWATGVFDAVAHRVGADPRPNRVRATATVGAIVMSAEAWAQDLARTHTAPGADGTDAVSDSPRSPTVPDRARSRAEFVDQLTAFLWPTIQSMGGDGLVGPLSVDEPEARGRADRTSSS